jgi:hypothetical protein
MHAGQASGPSGRYVGATVKSLSVPVCTESLEVERLGLSYPLFSNNVMIVVVVALCIVSGGSVIEYPRRSRTRKWKRDGIIRYHSWPNSSAQEARAMARKLDLRSQCFSIQPGCAIVLAGP